LPVGRYCSISWNVRVMGPHHGYHLVSNAAMMYHRGTPFKQAFDDFGVDWKFRKNPQKGLPSIGHDVWIGQDVLIARGISIGHGAVLAAGSGVTKDVPPYAIVGGVPARLIKWRFPEDLIARFLEVCWWDHPLPLLNSLRLDQPERFVEEMMEFKASPEAKP